MAKCGSTLEVVLLFKCKILVTFRINMDFMCTFIIRFHGGGFILLSLTLGQSVSVCVQPFFPLVCIRSPLVCLLFFLLTGVKTSILKHPQTCWAKNILGRMGMLKRADLRKHSKNGIYSFCFFLGLFALWFPLQIKQIILGGISTVELNKGKTPTTYENPLIQFTPPKGNFVLCTVHGNEEQKLNYFYPIWECANIAVLWRSWRIGNYLISVL